MAKKQTENQSTETASIPAATPSKKRVTKSVVENAVEWKFNENPVFEGAYTGDTVNYPDNYKEEEKRGKIIGFIFENEDGRFNIGSSYSIEKAISKIAVGDVLEIEFLGKTQVNGKPFNRFRIDRITYE